MNQQYVEQRDGSYYITGSRISLASVVYADATVASRRGLHRRLAVAVTDPEESAQHLALAIDRPDAQVAARLDEAATIVRARGGPGRAAEFLTRAIELTPPGDRRRGIARRVLDPVGTCGLQRGSERQPWSAQPHRPQGSVVAETHCSGIVRLMMAR